MVSLREEETKVCLGYFGVPEVCVCRQSHCCPKNGQCSGGIDDCWQTSHPPHSLGGRRAGLSWPSLLSLWLIPCSAFMVFLPPSSHFVLNAPFVDCSVWRSPLTRQLASTAGGKPPKHGRNPLTMTVDCRAPGARRTHILGWGKRLQC